MNDTQLTSFVQIIRDLHTPDAILAERNKIKFYRVGGCVRDLLLGVKAKDIDYAVEAESYHAMVDYIAANGKIYQERPQFFTVRARLNGQDCDYVLCRKEGAYTDGRRPDTVGVGTIYDDLARRDFTCNAIAMDDHGGIIDPHNGQIHIRDRRLRCVGIARDRFMEDHLRLLRAIRFGITKKFEFDVEIKKCLSDYKLVYNLSNIPIERIRDELFRCFKFDTNATLQMLNTYYHIRDIVFDRNLALIPTVTDEQAQH